MSIADALPIPGEPEEALSEMSVFAYAQIRDDPPSSGDLPFRSTWQRMEKWCNEIGLPAPFFCGVFWDEVSCLERVEFRILLSQLEPGDLLLVPSLDHLSQDPQVIREVMDALHGVRVNLANMEEGISPRPALQVPSVPVTALQLAEQGGPGSDICCCQDVDRFHGGGRPYGFNLQVKGDSTCLVPNPEEMAIIACAQKLVRHGKSLREIATILARVGVIRPNGKPLFAMQISRLIKKRYG